MDAPTCGYHIGVMIVADVRDRLSPGDLDHLVALLSGGDAARSGRWRRRLAEEGRDALLEAPGLLRLLLAAMDADIASVYAAAQIGGLKPRWGLEVLRLNARGPLAITELAGAGAPTHSAGTQKVAA